MRCACSEMKMDFQWYLFALMCTVCGTKQELRTEILPFPFELGANRKFSHPTKVFLKIFDSFATLEMGYFIFGSENKKKQTKKKTRTNGQTHWKF